MTKNTKTNAKNLHFLENTSFELYTVLSPFMRKMGLTPNMLTTISILFSFACAYSIYTQQYAWAGITILMSYLFDVFDGAFAREYKMYSKFGKVYDHFSDMIMALVILGSFYKYNKLKKNTRYILTIVIIFLLVMTYITQGCLTEIMEKEGKEGMMNIDTIIDGAEALHDKTFNDTRKYCVGNAEKTIQFTKHFGGETYTLFLAAVFFALHFAPNKF